MMLGTSDHNIEVGGCGGKQGISVDSCGWLFFVKNLVCVSIWFLMFVFNFIYSILFYIVFIVIFERSLEVKLPTIWTDEKQRWEESERREE